MWKGKHAGGAARTPFRPTLDALGGFAYHGFMRFIREFVRTHDRHVRRDITLEWIGRVIATSLKEITQSEGGSSI